ncbi:MAG: CHAT domain-containing protein [Bacteroidales bacterium]|nr:CHAT domain-containing protein [Bacteroidales bacterium]MBQ8811980.1 CHAT domain-containing protein [Bacteroidales bacterium]
MISLIACILLHIFSPLFRSNEPTVVEYVQKENGDYCAILHDKGSDVPKTIWLCSSSDIDEIDISADLYRGKKSAKVYELLIKPLEPHLNKLVHFKPAGRIHFINMAALTDNRGRRCCEKYNFRRVSSITSEYQKGTVDFSETRMYLFGGMVYDAVPERMFQNCWWIYRENYWGGQDGADQAYSSMGPERMWYTSEQLRQVVPDYPGWDMSTVSLGVADDGTRAGYDQLQYSRGEIKFIYSLKGFNIQKYTGDTALEEIFKLRCLWGSPSILHISTHSFTLDASQSPFSKYYDAKRLAYSTTGILFTGAGHTLEGYEMPYEMNDGLLYAEEIAAYDFSKVELLVLSACSTARGTVTNDGVWGIQSAFKDAGVKTIVSTLWSINDKAAAEFMKIFYSYLTTGSSKYEAFDLARKALIESDDFSDPLYWAPFIMLD